MTSKLLLWIPRVLTVIAIMFMLMFSFDALGGDQPFAKKLLGFLMNSIPVLILSAILIIAWKKELLGGILFIIASIATSVFFRGFSGNPASLIVTIPFCVVGILFILHYLLYVRSDIKE